MSFLSRNRSISGQPTGTRRVYRTWEPRRSPDAICANGTIANKSYDHIVETDHGHRDDYADATERTSLLESTSIENDPILSGSASSLRSIKSNCSKGVDTRTRAQKIFKYVKISILVSLLLVTIAFIMTSPDLGEETVQVGVNNILSKDLLLSTADSSHSYVKVTLSGRILERGSGATNETYALLDVRIHDTSEVWTLLVVNEANFTGISNTYSHRFSTPLNPENGLEMHFNTSSEDIVSLSVHYHSLTGAVEYDVVYAAVILVGVYVLISFDLVHRVMAAVLGSMAALAVLAATNQKPSLEKIMSWLEIETLALLFGMMIIVAILADTGVFNYVALLAYKAARGRIWPLVVILCALSGGISAFLDNVTTILLITPTTIKLCEVLQLDPKYILIVEVLFSNVGGTGTAIGDPPNVIIVSNKDIAANGITFANFTLHAAVGIVFVMVASFAFLRLIYVKMNLFQNLDPPEITDLKREIVMWRKTFDRTPNTTRDQVTVRALLQQKINLLETKLSNCEFIDRERQQVSFKETVIDLEKRYCITDGYLLLKCAVVLVVIMLLFFLHSFISGIHLGLGWIALMGGFTLLFLADMESMDRVIHGIEWSTLLFFAALFTLMEALGELGLISWIGDRIGEVIASVDDDKRMTVAIVIIVWISSIASSFIDNIPYTTAMVPVMIQLSEDKELKLELMPLVMSLAFGACLGGNGTIIGASANVVCAGIAEQHGHGFTFNEFFKIGFPMVLVTTVVATGYLMVCHVAFDWNS